MSLRAGLVGLPLALFGLMKLGAEYLPKSGDDVPLPGYALLLASFTVLFGGLLVRARHLPRKLGAGDILLLGIATHKLTRLITRDAVTAVVRSPFTRYEGSSGGGEVNESPRGDGLRRAVGSCSRVPSASPHGSLRRSRLPRSQDRDQRDWSRVLS